VLALNALRILFSCLLDRVDSSSGLGVADDFFFFGATLRAADAFLLEGVADWLILRRDKFMVID
tara:strand:+ start:222 stop:413 length:192 start_codon:yes stop_codon:yes gene_type:complete